MPTGACTEKDNLLGNRPAAVNDPFFVPTSPRTHYFPSKLRHNTKNIVLTPEKNKKFEAKDNQSYIPLNYSFCEEELEAIDDNQKEKQVATTTDHWSSSHFCELWPSTGQDISQEKSVKLFEKGSLAHPVPKAARMPEVASQESIEIDDNLLDFKGVDLFEMPRPRMSSTQNSSKPKNISLLVDRFRYGKPMSRNERKVYTPSLTRGNSTRKSADPTPRSRVGHNKETHLKASSVAKNRRESSSNLSEIDPPSPNDSISELQQKVERLLKDSELSLSGHPTIPSFSSSSYSNLTNGEKVSSLTEISPSTFNSGDSVTPKTDLTSNYSQPNLSSQPLPKTIHDVKNLFNKVSSTVPPPLTNHGVRESGDFYLSAKEELKQLLSPVKHSLPLQDDILQQWRLRRKMEAAQAPGFGKSTLHSATKQCRFAPAERPFVSQHEAYAKVPTIPISTPIENCIEKRSIGISTISTVCAETQTTPPPSVRWERDELDHLTSSRGIGVRRNSDVSLHKNASKGVAQVLSMKPSILRVTVVSGSEENVATGRERIVEREFPSPISTKSVLASTDTWDLNSTHSKMSSSEEVKSKRQGRTKIIATESDHSASPTTTVVKQVVGARLFNLPRVSSATPEAATTIATAPPSEESFISCTNVKTDTEDALVETRSIHDSEEATVEEIPASRGDSSSESSVCIDPNVLVENLLKCEEEEDYPLDPVLKSLRERRSHLISQLQNVEKKLKTVEKTEDVQS